MNGQFIYIRKSQTQTMSQLSEIRKVFRIIDSDIEKAIDAPKEERTSILQRLKMINEEMCDQVIDLRRKYEKSIRKESAEA